MSLSKKAKRRLWIVVGIVVGLPILVLLVIILRLGTVIRLGVERAGPMLLGVETRLDDADASLFGGTLDLSGLHVANPEGFKSDTFLKADEIRVGANIRALFQNEIHIREIILEGPEFTYELVGKKSNIGTLLERLDRGEEDDEDEAEKEGEPPKLKVDLIRITDATVRAVLLGETVSIKLGSLELRNLASADGNGIPARQVVREVLLNVLTDIKNVAELSDELKNIGDDLKDTLGESLEGGGDIGDELKKAGENLQDAGEGLRDQMKNILGR